MKPPALFSTLLTLLLAAGNVSHAQMYMRAVEAKQGVFQPGSAAPAVIGDGFIAVTDIVFNNKPVKVTKPTDVTSPKFLEAYLAKEAFTTVALKFAGKDKTGKQCVTMIITLTDAVMTDFKQNGESEVISWNYQKMEVTQPPAVTPTPVGTTTPVVTPITTLKPAVTPLVKKG